LTIITLNVRYNVVFDFDLVIHVVIFIMSIVLLFKYFYLLFMTWFYCF